MVDFVEQATLRVRDQSTKELNKINKAITALLKQGRELNKLKININGAAAAERAVKGLAATIKSVPKTKSVKVTATVSGGAQVKNTLAMLSKQRTVRVAVNARLTGTAAAQLAALTKGRNVNVNLNTRGGNGVRNAGQTLAQSFFATLKGGNAGATIARGFLAAIGGNLQQVVARTAAVGVAAPLNKEDAVQRLRIGGASEAVVRQVQQLASEMSGRYRGTTEAAIVDASVEAVGRIADPTTPEGADQLRVVLERIARNTQIAASIQGKGIEAGADTARLIEGAISQIGATGNNEEAAKISTAALRGLVASGGDLSGQDVKRVLQQLGGARGGLSEDTLTQLLLMRDEMGARGTGEFRQIFQDATRTNINAKDEAAQVANGLRDKKGRSTIAAGLQDNFLNTVRDEIIPRLLKDGVDINDKTDVLAGVDRMGFVAPGAIAALTDAVVNMKNMQQEFERSQSANLDRPISNPTTRLQGAAVNAQFQNLADNALGGVLPVVSSGLDMLAKSLASFNKGEGGARDFAAIGAGAVAAGVGSSIMAIAQSDPATRPLALAGLGLNTSAAALTGAAAALTTAAGVQAGAGAIGGAAGAVGRAGGVLAWLRGGLVAAGIAGGTAAVSKIVQVPLDAAANGISPGSVDKAKANEAEVSARGWEQFKQLLGSVKIGEVNPSAASSDFAKLYNAIVGYMSSSPVTPRGAAVNGMRSSLVQPETRQKDDLYTPNIASLTTVMQAAPSELTTAFATGNSGLQAVTSELSAVASAFGPEVGAALLAIAPQMGAIMGQAVSAAVSSATVNVNANVNTSEPKLDTGSQVPIN